MQIVKRIRNANKGRDPERLKMKYDAMRIDAFVFLRGTCHLFYDRLPKNGIFRSAPPVWCCGDLHLENFGSYKGDNRLVYFDINDFDEAALAPATWELARLLTSIFVSTRTAGIRAGDAEVLAEQFLDAYVAALTLGKPRWVERETSRGLVHDLLEQLRLRTRIEFLDGRTRKKGRQRRFLLDGKKTLPVTAEQHAAVTEFMAQFARTQPHPEFYRVIDIARRIAGTGSLGTERYAILVAGKGSPDQNYLLDLKQAQSSSIASHLKTIQPRWSNQAQRIVSLQRRMQAVSMAFLQPVVMDGKSYVLRALQPLEDRVPLARSHRNVSQWGGVVQVMGECVAWAQLRSGGHQGSAIADALTAFGSRRKWRVKLLDAARLQADQVEADWLVYCAAYDDGAFELQI